jgi:hypothetical protein
VSIGDLLDESVRLYRRNWIRLVTIAAIVTVPVTVLQAGSAFLNANTALAFGISRVPGAPSMRMLLGQTAQIVVSVIDGLLSALMLGAAVYVAGQSYLGRRIATGQAYHRAAQRFWVMIGSSVLSRLLILLLVIAALIPCVGWLGGPPVIVFVTVNLSALIFPVIMLEGRGVVASLRRSWLYPSANSGASCSLQSSCTCSTWRWSAGQRGWPLLCMPGWICHWPSRSPGKKQLPF